MNPTRIALDEATRRAIIELLQPRLADALDLQLMAKQAHWNIKGPSFIAIHELCDKVADECDEFADLLAERIVMFGGTARGTVRVAAATSSLAEFPLDATDWKTIAGALADRLGAFGAKVRAAIAQAGDLGDEGSADLLTEVSRGTDKLTWFVESHLLP